MATKLLQAARVGRCPRLLGPASVWGRGFQTSAASAPVVIVGAGPTGLTLSKLLSQLGVESLVLERAPSVTKHPQVALARGIDCLLPEELLLTLLLCN